MPPELIQWLPRSVAVVAAIVVAILFIISRLCETKEQVANALGPFGRAIHRRYKERVRRAAFDEAAYRALQRRIDQLEKLIRKLEREAEVKIHKLENEIKKLEIVEEVHAAHQDMTTEFLREDAQWHIDAGISAAEERYQLPSRRSYTQFCHDYREKHGLQHGRRWSDDSESKEWRKK